MKISPSRSIQITAAIGLVAVAALVYAGTFEPVITTQPQSQSAKEGESVTFSVTAGNSMNITVPLSSSVSLDMNWCPAGTFNMGSPTGELGKGADESQHQVTLTSGFWMGKYEVTQAQYKAVMGMNPSSYKDESNPLPVDSVSWRDATNFCARLTANEKAAGRLPKGYEYTLPSEAQWEYACRAGTTTALNSGKNLTSTSECSEMDEAGWYKANGANKTHPVGQKLPNAWGLYDMHGNVYEWCWDWYKADYPTDEVVDPAGPGLPVGSSKFRVYRGGSWNENAQNCRSASRGHDEPSHGGPQGGFRVVLTKSRNITLPLTDKLNLEMIWINPDTFTMGSPTGELGRKDNETQHQVTLTWEYWVGKYEVTQAQYEAVMGSKPDAFDGSKHGTGDDFPIYYVSRDEALEFCKQLTEREKAAGRLPAGYEYSLPTEAQWEYACRAGTTKALNNDHDLTSTTSCSSMDQVGWYKHNSGNNVHPTHGAREPNAWGIYDMHGNVWEWVLDWYGDYPTSAVIDPTGAATGSESSDRILRGGAMNQDAENCRSAMRSRHSSSASDDSGFRVALVVVSPEDVDPKTRDTEYPTPDNLSYQWYKDGEKPTPVGTNAASYTIKSVEKSDAGSYYVVVDNGLGSTISDKAVLTVIEKSLAYSYNTETHTATVVGIGEKAGTTEVVIPETVKYEGTVYTVTGIGNGAFMGDEDLINATIPNSVTSIGSNAFKECSGLTGIIIHAGVTSIGDGAFETCSSLTAVYFEGNAPKTGENVFTDTPAVIYYEPGTTGWTDPWCDKQTVMIADSRPKILKQPESQTVVEDESVTFSVTAENSNYLIVPLGSGVTMEMVWVDPGTFNMGSPEDELGRFKDEAQHEVTLTHGFWIGRYEVTQAQYDAQMGSNRSKFKGADLPVEHVSWYDATNFCARLTAHEKSAGRLPEGYSYTLPTEAQWEYACRAGTKTALNSGKDLSNVNECSEMDEVGWYQYNSNNTTHQVGQKLPNAWGLYDMHGNVREWCWDWYENDYPLTVPVDPVGPGVGEYRVLRGGDWDKTAQNCRSAYRTYSNPSVEDWDDVGFRVVLSYTPNITVPLAEGVDLEMIRIAHGNFEMGSPRDELGRHDNETQHKVTLTRDYWLGKLEVTQAQYQAVMGTNPSEFPGANLPVETVSWNDAMDFCAQLTANEKAAGRLPSGYEYTLPTEAQWEYACRAETKTALNSGKNLTSKDECPNMDECPEMDEVGWYWYNSGNKTHSVGQKQSNAWGLYDMHGNVFEWCLDWYGDYPSSAVVDPTGPDTGTYRVIRGGSWSNNAGDCRSAYRSYNAIGSWNKGGFRVALVLVSPNDIAPVLEPDTPSTIMSLNYQWYKDGTPISGEKASSYTITSVKGSDEGSYKVTVSNPFGRTESNDAKLTVEPSITIITQPASQIVTYGDKTEMKVEATAAGTITYQWYQNDAAIGGANEAVYTLDKTLLTDAGEYYVVLTSGNTAVPSDKATLTVNKASLTVTAPTLTGVVYGSPKPELTADLDGVVPGDTVTATVNTTYTQGAGVGTYPTTIAEITGAENYIVTEVPGSLTVTAKPLTVTLDNASVVYGQNAVLPDEQFTGLY